MNIKEPIMKEPMMRKLLLCLMILSISVLIVFCGSVSTSQDASSTGDSGSGSMNSTLIQPMVKLNETVTKKLPLKLWEWNGEIKRYTVTTEHQSGSGTAKKMHCVIKGEGSALPIGAEVEEIEEAVCTHVMHDHNGFKKYAVGLKKIKVKSTGEVGWTWASSVQKSE